jgi:hypothetical protein
MKLPQSAAHYTHRVRSGRYTAARLKKAKRAEQAASIDQATSKVKTSGRKVEDCMDAIDTATAFRDAADADMDDPTKHFRKQLAARSLTADKEPPYTAIFPQGIGYYVAATVSENVNRYNELITRVETNLPADDALRTALVPAIKAGIEDYKTASDELSKARTALSMARTESDAARDEWETLMEKTYGSLIVDFGKQAAEKFFLKTGGSGPADDTEDPGPPDPAA